MMQTTPPMMNVELKMRPIGCLTYFIERSGYPVTVVERVRLVRPYKPQATDSPAAPCLAHA